MILFPCAPKATPNLFVDIKFKRRVTSAAHRALPPSGVMVPQEPQEAEVPCSPPLLCREMLLRGSAHIRHSEPAPQRRSIFIWKYATCLAKVEALRKKQKERERKGKKK